MIPLKPSAIFVLISASLLGGDLPSLAADVPPDITVPRGFVIERIAAPPLVEHPMMACFDDYGRLFVAEAAGLNLKSDDLLKNPPNYITVLEDAQHTGVFDQSHVFADKMTLP